MRARQVTGFASTVKSSRGEGEDKFWVGREGLED